MFPRRFGAILLILNSEMLFFKPIFFFKIRFIPAEARSHHCVEQEVMFCTEHIPLLTSHDVKQPIIECTQQFARQHLQWPVEQWRASPRNATAPAAMATADLKVGCYQSRLKEWIMCHSDTALLWRLGMWIPMLTGNG